MPICVQRRACASRHRARVAKRPFQSAYDDVVTAMKCQRLIRNGTVYRQSAANRYHRQRTVVFDSARRKDGVCGMRREVVPKNEVMVHRARNVWCCARCVEEAGGKIAAQRVTYRPSGAARNRAEGHVIQRHAVSGNGIAAYVSGPHAGRCSTVPLVLNECCAATRANAALQAHAVVREPANSAKGAVLASRDHD